jgi:hypothetical protein
MNEFSRQRKRLLDPYDRISEALFGLIMTLTFTGSLSVSQSGRDDVHAMLIGALGCNLSWGIIDAIFYLMASLSEKGTGLRVLRSVRRAASPQAAHHAIADALPPLVAATLTAEEKEVIRLRILSLPEPPAFPCLDWKDGKGALSVFFWVVLITLPVAVPFMFMGDVTNAMRVSNVVAVLLLFLCGWAFGRVAGYHPLPTGIVMVFIGICIVALTISLGG